MFYRPYLLPWEVSVHVIEPQGFTTNMTSKDTVTKGMTRLWNNLNRQTKEEFGKDYLDSCMSLISGFSLIFSVIRVVRGLTPHSHRSRKCNVTCA